MQETQAQSLVGKIPRRREWQPAPVFLPGESHGQWSLAGYSPWGHKQLDSAPSLPANVRAAGGASPQPRGHLGTGPVPWGDVLRASSTRLHGLLPPSCLHFYGHTQQQIPGVLLIFLKHQQVSWGHDGDTCPHLPHLFSPGPTFKLALHGLIHF